MGYTELDFLGNVERELSSEKMSFSNNGNLHGEKEDFVRCQDLCISHRKNCPGGSFLDTQSHIRSLAVVKTRRPGACMEVAKTRGERKKTKDRVRIDCGYE